MTANLAPIEPRTCVVRNTGAHHGRRLSVPPENSAARHLHFGRIVLDAADAPLTFNNGDRESGFICLKGMANINGTNLTRYDAMYVPRDSDVKLSGACDIAEVSAPVA